LLIPRVASRLSSFVRDIFELGADAGATLVRGTDHGDATDGLEVLEESLHIVRVLGGLLGPEVKEAGEEVAEDTGQDVDVEFLVGPVALRSQGDVDGVLEVCEDGFDSSLAAVGADDLGGSPVVAVGDEDDATEGVAIEGVEGMVVEGVGDRQAAFGLRQMDLEDLTEVLATSQSGLDVVPDPGEASPLLSPLQGLAQTSEPALGRGDVLEDSPLLAFAQAFGQQDDDRSLDTPQSASCPKGQDLLFVVEGDGLHQGVCLGHEGLLARGGDGGHVVQT
jgi:hypothetical protein